MDRYLSDQFKRHFVQEKQMLLLSGPWQVGKTTVARQIVSAAREGHYFNWENQTHRRQIVDGPGQIAESLGLDKLQTSPGFCAFDELHKYRRWREFMRGLFDTYEERVKLLVTGSAHLETFSQGGDSLLGRYQPFTLHPLSVAELTYSRPNGVINKEPREIDKSYWKSLWRFGGFPEPFLKSEQVFHQRWLNLRQQQLMRNDLRDLTRIQEIDQLELLATALTQQVGRLTSFTQLAKVVRVSVDTVRRWIDTLESLHFCFTVRPWHRNVTRALRKEPKYYVWDWSQLENSAARAENMVASALLKAVHWWTESGQGEFDLHFIRDREKREVDFVVTYDGAPWFLVDVKTSGKEKLSEHLVRFQRETRAAHAFQVAMDAPYVDEDCFSRTDPVIVPAKTFLAQLV